MRLIASSVTDLSSQRIALEAQPWAAIIVLPRPDDPRARVSHSFFDRLSDLLEEPGLPRLQQRRKQPRASLHAAWREGKPAIG